ncbi:cytochrome C [Geomonas paludis]|uniref:Cytochrome C n=1 Tax=Geomonas paludis TaxID=2740185 RepID=A0A6V8MTJ4_9BACT|nr:cytochrome c3 family protein [Geomonas paludis]UPU37992.1 cytochrome C [Geomonas paludis]GFO63485.1 cytochrome c [Geomonas paludis]
MKAIILLVAYLILTNPGFAADTKSQCVICHSDKAMMKKLGAESLYLDPAQVDREVRMPGATCVDCHLGDGGKADKEGAHQGMVRPFLVGVGPKLKGQALSREAAGALKALMPRANDMESMIPEGDAAKFAAAGIKTVANIHWQDRDPNSFAFSPAVAEKTCGRCHAQEVKDYSSSEMGRLKHQRSYRSWSEQLPGPQNCGMWFGQNYDNLKGQTAVPYSEAQNAASDRSCNMCHPGCNDCHFKPHAGKGSHSFGLPDTASCYGGGRGSICHAGPMDRRRGAGFFRGDYSFPPNLPQDTHFKAGLQCTDCHKPVNHKFGHLGSDKARASCGNCHADIVQALASSVHGKVDCAACHVTLVGAYQYTFWGPGMTFGVETPYGKHKEYYGTRDLPTIIRNADGRWIGVKPYPMAVMNQTRELAPTGLLFRAIPKREIPGNPAIGEPALFEAVRGVRDVNDAYIGVGTRSDLPSGNKAILWVQMDKMSHAIGKPRGCRTCHDSYAQVGKSQWSYFEKSDVKKAFKGSYTVVADRDGMRFTDQVWEKPEMAGTRKVEDIAPFTLLPSTAWDVKGIDFSLPYDQQKTDAARRELDAFLAGYIAAGAEAKKIRSIAYHNLALAKAMLKQR